MYDSINSKVEILYSYGLDYLQIAEILEISYSRVRDIIEDE